MAIAPLSPFPPHPRQRIRQDVLAIILATINILGVVTFISIRQPLLSTILGLEEASAGASGQGRQFMRSHKRFLLVKPLERKG